MGPALLRRRRQPRRKSPFPSKRAALAHYRDVIEPQLLGEPAPMPDLTLSGLVDALSRAPRRQRATADDRHAARTARARRRAHSASVPLRDLERMSGEIATWQARLPERSRYGVVQALRQTLGAAVRWGYMSSNPALLAGRNRQPRRAPCARTAATNSTRSRAELPPIYATAADVRRRDRAAAGGVAGARTPRHRPRAPAR